MHEFGEVKVVCAFRGDIPSKQFTLVWSHIIKNEQKCHPKKPELVETFPRSTCIHDFFGTEFVVYFKRRCCLQFFLPYGPMLTERKKM